MPTSTLHHLARKACIKNIRSITDVGDVPYDLLRPILIKLENPHQLRSLEESSPQLCGPDAEIWRDFIKRDIPRWEQKLHEPKNPTNWYKVYCKLIAESDEEVAKDEAILRATLGSIKTEQAKHTSKVVDERSVPRLPRMGGMRKEGGRARTTTKSSPSSTLTFTSGSKTKMLSGKGVLEKARREAREMSLFSARKSRLAVPTHKLGSKASAIHTAPHGLLNDHRKPAKPAYVDAPVRATQIFAPRKKPFPAPVGMVTAAEREDRLKAFTTKSSSAKAPPPPAPAADSLRPQKTTGIPAPSKTAAPSHPSSAYIAPRMKRQNAEKRKAPVDPFIPAKRKKVA